MTKVFASLTYLPGSRANGTAEMTRFVAIPAHQEQTDTERRKLEMATLCKQDQEEGQKLDYQSSWRSQLIGEIVTVT